MARPTSKSDSRPIKAASKIRQKKNLSGKTPKKNQKKNQKIVIVKKRITLREIFTEKGTHSTGPMALVLRYHR